MRQTRAIAIHPSTRQAVRIHAAATGQTIRGALAALLEALASQENPPVPHIRTPDRRRRTFAVEADAAAWARLDALRRDQNRTWNDLTHAALGGAE